MTDTVADLLTRIRNSSATGHRSCDIPYSKFNEQLLNAMQKAGYLESVDKEKDVDRPCLKVKFQAGKIRWVGRLSKPGRRLYVGYRDIPVIKRGFGTVIISTPGGIMTGSEAKEKKLGGELICELL